MHGVCALFYFDLILKRKYKYLVNFAMVGVFFVVCMCVCVFWVCKCGTLDYLYTRTNVLVLLAEAEVNTHAVTHLQEIDEKLEK